MSFRLGRALTGDRPDSGEDAEPDDDPGLTATIAASELDLRPFVGGLLILVGGVLGVPILVMFGVVILVIAWLRWLWAGRALRRLQFERRFEPDRVMCGDEAHLVITVWNRKLLPLSWLRAQEPLPAELQPVGGTEVRVGTVGSRTLVNGWTLGPYERAVRRIGLRTEHRGIYRFATVGLAAGDLLGEAVADEDRHLAATLVVRPRTVPVRRFEAARDRSGPLRARRGLVEDPARFSGVRPYAPGDPVRHIHWRTTARLGVPLVKRFDPSRDRDVVVALDIQTTDGAWAGRHDDDLAETLCVVAASLARQLEAEGAAGGLAVAAFTGTTERMAFLAPSASERQPAGPATCLPGSARTRRRHSSTCSVGSPGWSAGDPHRDRVGPRPAGLAAGRPAARPVRFRDRPPGGRSGRRSARPAFAGGTADRSARPGSTATGGR